MKNMRMSFAGEEYEGSGEQGYESADSQNKVINRAYEESPDQSARLENPEEVSAMEDPEYGVPLIEEASGFGDNLFIGTAGDGAHFPRSMARCSGFFGSPT